EMSSLQYTPAAGGLPTLPRHWLNVTLPTGTPSTKTNIVEPSVGIQTSSPGTNKYLAASAQPKFATALAVTSSPCAGVSMVPKGFWMNGFLRFRVFEPGEPFHWLYPRPRP